MPKWAASNQVRRNPNKPEQNDLAETWKNQKAQTHDPQSFSKILHVQSQRKFSPKT